MLSKNRNKKCSNTMHLPKQQRSLTLTVHGLQSTVERSRSPHSASSSLPIVPSPWVSWSIFSLIYYAFPLTPWMDGWMYASIL
jgi:hypothetical protein